MPQKLKLSPAEVSQLRTMRVKEKAEEAEWKAAAGCRRRRWIDEVKAKADGQAAIDFWRAGCEGSGK